MSIDESTQKQEGNNQKKVWRMAPDQARQIVANCVCGSCFGRLVTRYDWRTQTSEVTCVNESCPTDGFVTRSWLEQAKAQSAAEAAEARFVLGQALAWINPHAGKKVDQLLHELGF